MTWVGYCGFESPIYEKFIEKIKSIHTNGKLKNGFSYLYQDFQFDVINVIKI